MNIRRLTNETFFCCFGLLLACGLLSSCQTVKPTSPTSPVKSASDAPSGAQHLFQLSSAPSINLHPDDENRATTAKTAVLAYPSCRDVETEIRSLAHDSGFTVTERLTQTLAKSLLIVKSDPANRLFKVVGIVLFIPSSEGRPSLKRCQSTTTVLEIVKM